MKQIIETKRLILRELNIDDAENFFQLNKNPNVIKYTGDQAFESVEAAELFLANYTEYVKNGYGRWAVVEKETNDFLGWCGLKLTSEINETDIGFRFFEKHWNKGFATESALASLQFGFEQLKLETIVGRAMAENSASIRVLEKLGMQYEREFDFAQHKGLIYRMNKEQLMR